MKKICTKCGKDKDLGEYYKNDRHKDGKQSACKNCCNIMGKKYRIDHKQKTAKYGEKYRKTKQYKLTRIKYKKSDKGKLTQAKYSKSEKRKKIDVKYRKTNKGRLADIRTTKKYRATDKGKASIARINHNRRINIAKTINTLTDKEFNYIIFLQDNQCIGPDCESGRYFTNKVKPTRDHINPVKLGGDFTIYTVQALCNSCNSKKGTNYVDYRSKYHKKIITNYNHK